MAVIKIIEIIGSSPKSWEDAAKNAVSEAAKTVKNIKGVDIIHFTAVIKDNKVTEYRANVKVAFMVEEER
jgi:hypothetical protein